MFILIFTKIDTSLWNSMSGALYLKLLNFNLFGEAMETRGLVRWALGGLIATLIKLMLSDYS